LIATRGFIYKREIWNGSRNGSTKISDLLEEGETEMTGLKTRAACSE